MPRATVVLEPEDKKDLKTCAEGWVQLRRMSYGAKLNRMKHVGKMSVDMSKRRGSARGEMDLMQKSATVYDFQHCLVDHNLEDEAGNKLNLHSEADIDRLDPRIGEEISSLIDELNNFEDADNDLGNSTTASGPQ